VFEFFVVALIAFAAGYGVRELISRRRRAAVRERALQSLSRQEQIDNLKLMAKLGLPLSETHSKR
jgi:hypothetical protein